MVKTLIKIKDTNVSHAGKHLYWMNQQRVNYKIVNIFSKNLSDI